MSEPLWTSSEIAAATGGRASSDFEVSGLSIDTRSLELGEMFVALADVRDGHDFAGNAFEAGASGALVSKSVEDGPVVHVHDVQVALERLGLAARARASDCYRVAITGSVGKTSLKEMLARIFRAHGPAHWNVKSFNNQWGVPLTLARMPRETERAVFEIGMNTPGEIAPRSHMVAPHAGIITKIAAAHLEGLGSVQGIAGEKSDIFAGLLPGGAAILPSDDEFFDYLSGRAKEMQPECRILTFGMDRRADAHVHQIYTDATSVSVYLMIHSEEVNVELNAVGDHWAVNAAIAILAACEAPGITPQSAAEALSGYAPPPGRGTAERLELPDGGEFTLVDDAYNANPESMRAALAGFAQRPCAGRRLVGLGEMLEIGAGAAEAHADLAGPILRSGAHQVFLAGAGMQALVDSLGERIESKWAETADSLYSDISVTLKDGDLLLLKGSNASGMGKLADRLRQWSAAAKSKVMDRGPEQVAGGLDAV